MPNDLNISSEDENVSTRPFRMSSIDCSIAESFLRFGIHTFVTPRTMLIAFFMSRAIDISSKFTINTPGWGNFDAIASIVFIV